MTTKTETEQLRAEFEEWALRERIAYRDEKRGVCFYNGERNSYWIGYQAGRAALQSEDQKDAERYLWLRAGGNDDIGVVRGFDGIDYGSTSVAYTYEEGLDGDQLDEAIDHARRVEGE